MVELRRTVVAIARATKTGVEKHMQRLDSLEAQPCISNYVRENFNPTELKACLDLLE